MTKQEINTARFIQRMCKARLKMEIDYRECMCWIEAAILGAGIL